MFAAVDETPKGKNCPAINTGTTIVTFLLVFLIQNTQNRDTLALQVKLAKLIVVLEKADNRFAAIEDASDDELKAAHEQLKLQANGDNHHGRKKSKRQTRKAAKSS